MTETRHIEHAELVGFLDGELEESRAEAVRVHLAGCAVCLAEHDRLRDISAQISALVASPQLEDAGVAGRAQLLGNLRTTDSQAVVAMPPSKNKRADAVLRRFGWGMALAASLALALIVMPHRTPTGTVDKPVATAPRAQQVASLDVNGESFVALPYSNPDLPLNAPRIVEMQVPISSLTAAGISLDPAMAWTPDRTVRANVLLGMDGQPLGLHVLAAE